MINRRDSLKGLGIIAAGVFAPALVHAQKVKTLRFGHVLPEGHPYHQGLVKFGEELEKRTAGSVKVIVYPGGQLGGEVKMIEAMGLGTIDGGAVAAGSLALTHRAKKFYLLDVPYVFKNYASVETFAESPVAEEITALKPGSGIRILGLASAGFHQMINSKRPIQSPADLRGMKFRVWESPSATLAFEMLGMSPTPMAFGEVFTALQQGVVDGLTNSMTTFYLSKLHEVAKFVTLSNHQYSFVLPLMSEASLAALGKDEREAVVSAGKEACRFWRAIYPTQDAQFRPRLEEAGAKINTVDRAAFVKHVRDQYGRFKDLVGEPGTEELMARMVQIGDA